MYIEYKESFHNYKSKRHILLAFCAHIVCVCRVSTLVFGEMIKLIRFVLTQ